MAAPSILARNRRAARAGAALDALAMGEDEARSLGVPVALVRYGAIAAATFITALAVSLAGMIGWIGLFAPHFARLAGRAAQCGAAARLARWSARSSSLAPIVWRAPSSRPKSRSASSPNFSAFPPSCWSCAAAGGVGHERPRAGWRRSAPLTGTRGRVLDGASLDDRRRRNRRAARRQWLGQDHLAAPADGFFARRRAAGSFSTARRWRRSAAAPLRKRSPMSRRSTPRLFPIWCAMWWRSGGCRKQAGSARRRRRTPKGSTRSWGG